MTTDVLSDTDVSLKVVSNASGRMRVCVTGFNVDAVRAVAIEETVSQVTGVHAVHAYPRTASVVIWYSPELGDTAAVLSAITKAQHVPAELVPARAPHSAGVRGVGVVRKITGGIRRMLSRPPGVDKPLKASRCGGRPRGPVRGTAGEQGRIHPARGAGLVHLLADDDGVGAVTAATTDRLGKAGAQQPGGPGEPVQAAGQLADPFPLVDVRQDLALGKGAHRFSQLLALRCGPDVHNRVSGISTWRLRSHSPSPLACGSKRAW